MLPQGGSYIGFPMEKTTAEASMDRLICIRIRCKRVIVTGIYREIVTDCTYCGQTTEAHDPVFVFEEGDGERVSVGEFCNYACLSAHIEENDLVNGACCRLDA